MPIEAVVDLIALDSLGQPVDTLFAVETIAPAQVEADGKVYESVRSKIHYELNKSSIAQLKNATRMVFLGRYSTGDLPTQVKLYDHYSTELKLTGNFQYRVN